MDRLTEIEQIFSTYENIEITQPFYENKNGEILGEISMIVENEVLTFSVAIPVEYPFLTHPEGVSTTFRCHEIEGYAHHFPIRSDVICLHPQSTSILDERLREEIKLLRIWMKKYYIEEMVDEYYEYLPFKPLDDNPQTHLFFTDTHRNFHKGEYGKFKYRLCTNYKQEIMMPNIEFGMVLSFDESTNCEWSKDRGDSSSLDTCEGYWIYIENEPIIAPYMIVNSWNELNFLFISKTTPISIYLKKA